MDLNINNILYKNEINKDDIYKFQFDSKLWKISKLFIIIIHLI